MTARKPLPRLPSKRAVALEEIQDRRDTIAAAAEKKMQRLKEAADKVAKTPEGRAVLQYICGVCGWDVVPAVRKYQPGPDGRSVLTDVMPEATIHNVAKQEVWYIIRRLFDKRTRNILEP